MKMPDVTTHRLRGTAVGVGRDTAEPVDGVYELSTIEWRGGHDTVGFKMSGVGPDQITEPRHVKTLTVEPS